MITLLLCFMLKKNVNELKERVIESMWEGNAVDINALTPPQSDI